VATSKTLPEKWQKNFPTRIVKVENGPLSAKAAKQLV